MDERFGSWLRDAMADIDEDILKKRWSAIESLSSDLEHSEILDLILFCANGRMRDANTLAKVRRAFWTHDNAFNMENNGLELKRLCGAVVIHVLSGPSEHKMDFSMVIACLHFGGLHPDFGLPAMAVEAEEILQKLSSNIRSAAAVTGTAKRVINPAKVLEPFKQKVAANQWQQAIPDLEPVFAAYGRALNQLASDNGRIQAGLEIQKEETNILWWLTGAYSNDLEIPFKKFDRPVAAIVAGKELADHVIHRPGPLGAASILSRIILNGAGAAKTASLSDSVVAIPVAWKKQVANQVDDLALNYCPMLAAISHSVEVDNEKSWSTLFSKRFPHPIKKEVPVDLLALQMCREWMLALDIATWK